MAYRKLKVIKCSVGKCPANCRPCNGVLNGLDKCCKIIAQKAKQEGIVQRQLAESIAQHRRKKS